MNLDLNNRSPKLELLPDRRQRVTTIADVLNNIPKTPAGLVEAGLWEAWGTSHPEYPTCRLIHQDITGQAGEFRAPNQEPPQLVRIYEEIDATAETAVGRTDVTFDQYGIQTITNEAIQFSAGTSIYAVPGYSTAIAPNGQLCVLKIETRTNDGTLQRIKREYCDHGELSDNTEIKFDGRLLLRTIASLNEIPATPAGYTLITRSTEFINGLPVYRYGFAAGGGGGGTGTGGEISRSIEYLLSPDQGTTGVTKTTIRYLTDPSVAANPITGPVGSQLISVDHSDQDGYRIWTAVYAAGTGTVTYDIDIREGGKLYVYKKTAINGAPSAPAASIGGTVTLISQNVRNGSDPTSGTVVYDYEWAEGIGTISTDTAYSQSVTTGTAGLTTVTTRALTALGASNPVTSPGAGFILVSFSSNAQDGYLLWNVIYAKGTGTVTTDVDTKDGGKLIVYRTVALGTAPSTPAATIGGTVTLISTDVRVDSGYTIYNYQWAEGLGEVSRDIDYSQSIDQGTTGVTKTVIKYLVAIGASIQPTSLSGSTLASKDYAEQDGYGVWTTTWAKGLGAVSTDVRYLNWGKLVIYSITSLGNAPVTPSPTIGGTVTLIESDLRLADGYAIYEYKWAEGYGVIDIQTSPREGGLRVETWTSINAGTAIYSGFIPAGTVVTEDHQFEDGFTKWVVSAMQKSDGAAINYGGDMIVMSFTTKRPFTYPGRAKAITSTVSAIGLNRSCYDVFKSSPVEIMVDATVAISYQTSSAVGALPYTLWNPDSWATIFAKFWGWNAQPLSPVIPLTGFRAVSETPITFNGGNGYEQTCLGERVYGLTAGTSVFSLQVTGGPVAPDTNTYTLAVSVEPAFIGYNGVQYYRKTVVYATIPTQTALPV